MYIGKERANSDLLSFPAMILSLPLVILKVSHDYSIRNLTPEVIK